MVNNSSLTEKQASQTYIVFRIKSIIFFQFLDFLDSLKNFYAAKSFLVSCTNLKMLKNSRYSAEHLLEKVK